MKGGGRVEDNTRVGAVSTRPWNSNDWGDKLSDAVSDLEKLTPDHELFQVHRDGIMFDLSLDPNTPDVDVLAAMAAMRCFTRAVPKARTYVSSQTQGGPGGSESRARHTGVGDANRVQVEFRRFFTLIGALEQLDAEWTGRLIATMWVTAKPGVVLEAGNVSRAMVVSVCARKQRWAGRWRCPCGVRAGVRGSGQTFAGRGAMTCPGTCWIAVWPS